MFELAHSVSRLSCDNNVNVILQEAEGKIHELEDRVIEERQKGQASKRDQAELIRSHKVEIKSLMEKVEK